MADTTIRKQGGAAIMTIPGDVLKRLGIDVGSALEISVDDNGFTARPKARLPRHRFSLRELLRGATPEAMRELSEETAWSREGDPVGREL